MTSEMLNVERGLQVVISPLIEESLTVSWLIGPLTHNSVVSDFQSDISAPHYNRPFFFWKYRISGLTMVIALLVFILSTGFVYRLLGRRPKEVINSHEHITCHLIGITILNVTLLLRIQSYIPLSEPALIFGMFGMQAVITSIYILIGMNLELRGSRLFFTFGSIVGVLMLSVTATGILPLLTATNGLPASAKIAIVTGWLLVLTVSTTWPVLATGNTIKRFSSNEIARIFLFTAFTLVTNFLIVRFMGISAGVWGMALVMLVLSRKALAIQIQEFQPATTVSTADERLVVEIINEPTSIVEPLQGPSSSTEFPFAENSGNTNGPLGF
jgi:hypothetical protein